MPVKIVLGGGKFFSNSARHGPSVSYSGASTIIICVTGICGIFCNVSMLISIDIIFYGPQIPITYTVYYDFRGTTVGERGPWRGCSLI
jgi:hypothetical protein